MNYPHGKTTFLSISYSSVCVQLSTSQPLLLLSSAPVKLFVLICQCSLVKIKPYHRILKQMILPSYHKQFPLLNRFCAFLVANRALWRWASDLHRSASIYTEMYNNTMR